MRAWLEHGGSGAQPTLAPQGELAPWAGTAQLGTGSLRAQSCSLEDTGTQTKSSLFPGTKVQGSPDGGAMWGAVLGMLCAPLLRAEVPKTPVGSLVPRLGSCPRALGC